jgi:hypothetical protein
LGLAAAAFVEGVKLWQYEISFQLWAAARLGVAPESSARRDGAYVPSGAVARDERAIRPRVDRSGPSAATVPEDDPVRVAVLDHAGALIRCPKSDIRLASQAE